MSKYFSDYDAVSAKLDELLAANNLIGKFNHNYPITLTVTPDTSPEAQMEMFDTGTDGASSRDAKLVISFPVGDIGLRVFGRLIISDALMGKIKGFAKKMHYLYLQADYAARYENAKLNGNAEDVHDDPDECDPEDGGEFDDFFDETPDDE